MVDNQTTTGQITADVPDVHRSRAERMSQPRTIEVLQKLATEHGVCIRPVPMRRIDHTGLTQIIDIACGSTRAAKCPPCAAKAKRLRQVQCRQGWHRADEPIQVEPASDDQHELIVRRAELEFSRARHEQLGEWDQADKLAAQIDEIEQQITLSGLRGATGQPNKRRVRSTRRRPDTASLPKRHVSPRTVGHVYIGRDGSEHRSSMFLTLTLDSYGPVRRADSTPRDMDTYDYRRAALDAVHFPALLDRFWQNLRRAVGWNVQYFGCIEPQRRLAPHAHYAARGSFPRAVFRQVAAGTYHQVWQPSTTTVMFTDGGPQPEWLDADDDELPGGYISPWTGKLLPTWEQSMDTLDEQIADGLIGPAHVVRFGVQAHAAGTTEDQDDDQHDQGANGERSTGVEGMEAGTLKAETTIRYITKYITKSVDECHTRTTPRQTEHHSRFYEELRFTPCSPRCANWLRYGIQPQDARPGMIAGRCKGRVHQHSTLGIGGRRILVSRDWSGKTLADHKADQNAWVRRVLALGLGHQLADDNTTEDGSDSAQDNAGVTDSGAETTGDPDAICGSGEQHEGDDPPRKDTTGWVRWERLNPRDDKVAPLHRRLWRSLGERIRRRTEWQTALDRLTQETRPPAHIPATE